MGFKEKMMENMMGKISSEEKQEMMNSMMPKMMENMMCGDGPSSVRKNSMMDMMGSMMEDKGETGETGFNSMDMCKKMMSTISQSSEIATFATPEVRQLFEEWVQQVDEEIMNLIQKNDSISPDKIAQELKISKNSVIYFLSRLAQKGKISLDIKRI